MRTKPTAENHYVVATVRPWNVAQYQKALPTLTGHWHLITESDQLTKAHLDTLHPRYIFFPHWNHKVPEDILAAYECVCFHMTDVPFGRGGSPLQNLIVRGETETKVTALRMVKELDAGPVYTKRDLSLHGLAEEIYLRAAAIVFEIIRDIATQQPAPTPQTGDVTTFKRRTPAQSDISKDITTLEGLFDHIRMLDAVGYPAAYLDYGNFRLAFSRPALKSGRIAASVTITPIKDEKNGS